MAECSGLGIWRFRGGIGKLGENVWMMTWKCFFAPVMDGLGICRGTSYGQTSNPSFTWKKWAFSK